MEKEKEFRTRNYATILYPESAPADWREILSDEHVGVLISPYHDQDLDPTGEPKKAHYHIMILFDGVKSQRQAEEFINRFGGVGCKRVNSLRGYARYLCHLDNPEKHQYNISDVVQMHGVDYEEIIALESDKYPIIDEILQFCDKYDVTSFYLLTKYAFKHNESWKRVLLNGNTLFIKEYLKSKIWSKEMNMTHIIDSSGEILI